MEAKTIGFTIIFLIALVAIIGWIANIIKLAGMDILTTGEGVLRIVGIFVPPLGSFMGLFI